MLRMYEEVKEEDVVVVMMMMMMMKQMGTQAWERAGFIS